MTYNHFHEYYFTNLSGRSFKDRNLTRCSFKGCDLTGADFSGAKIDNVNFIDTDLSVANWGGLILLARGIVNKNAICWTSILGGCIIQRNGISFDIKKSKFKVGDVDVKYLTAVWEHYKEVHGL
jgi:uncharacterized protein YjbI with pentapeptide repeats